jgi:hypothetical protein
MEQLNTEKLIERIEEAKGWLNKAQTEYSNSNPVRGGLILNLAQAEVKHAWELSHQQFVSQNVPQQKRNLKLKYIIPIAASLTLISGLLVGARVAGLFSTTAKSKIPEVASSKAETLNKSTHNVAVTLQPSPAAVTPEALETAALTASPTSIPNTKLPPEIKKGEVSLRKTDVLSHGGTNIIQDKPAIKAVSTLAIDEEALTKEASHSLRVGK